MDGAQARRTDSVTVSSEEQRPPSSYFSSLNYTAKKRYLEKLKKGSFSVEDPFSIDDGQWLEDLSQWPELEFGDIYSYLIDTKATYTKEKLRAYKSLDAYNYFFNGHVRTVYHLSRSSHDILKAKVNPSQRSADKNHEAWILVEHNGTVITGHCTCMAG